MRFGPFDVTAYDHGTFRLDGGAMFGTVPKAIWAKLSPPDDDNRILLAARSLIIRAGDRVVLVDAGMGDRWTEKLRRIYDIRPAEGDGPGLDAGGVTDVILTHLHFDHARGIFRARPGEEGQVDLRYPEARIHVQAANYETAREPNARERASYIAEDTKLLERTRLVLASGSREIVPGIWVHRTNGHTRGHQWVEVRTEGRSLAFPADIVPTSRHLPLPYLMGYDISAETLLIEKDALLGRAVDEGWILVFSHDPDVEAGRVGRDEKGHYALAEALAL
jgi:glyoxylase-like metal-dependent hydrolase (beta-lactamase superfamily II)